MESKEKVSYASFWRRLGAFAVDIALIGLVIRVLFPRVEDKLPKLTHRANWLFDIVFSFPALLNLFCEGCYLIYLWKNTGQTFGQKIFGIKVVKKDGSELTYVDAVVRYIGYIISGAFIGIGYLWMIIDADNQGLHDKMANTIVIRCPKKTEETTDKVTEEE
ncbi:MAG: RDD family protein [Dehalococcoidales bacterium]|nr:RDD family protein [Dehalococcoidales bacterium]